MIEDDNRKGEVFRVTRDEMYPMVGEATAPLKALIPAFGDKIVAALIEGIQDGKLASAHLRLIHQGNNPHILEANIRGLDSSGSVLEIELAGDWDSQTRIPKGLPVTANFDGKYYRKMKPTDPEPIAQEGQVLEPNDSFALAMQGKNKRWFLKLPPTDFPRGGRISLFTHPDGEDVVRGQSILLYVEPL